MTRKEDPGQWWYRTARWLALVVLVPAAGYIAVKWDKSADAVITMSVNIANMSEDIKDIRDDGKLTKEDIKAVRDDVSALKTTTDARLKELEKSEWWRDLIGETNEEEKK